MIVTSRYIQISRRLVQTMQQSATARIIRNSSSYVDTKWSLSENNPYTLDDYQRIQGHLMDRIKWRPRIGIICGSGLGGLADRINDARKVSYQDIPGFPVNTAPGHAGQFVFGMLSGKPVMCMQGRFHLYEGYQPWQLTIPIRVMKLLGVHTLIVTNAAGSLHPEYNVGDVMVIKDHINMPGLVNFNPLCGPNIDSFGPRFPSLCNAYDWDLRHDLFQAAKELHLENIMREGIYCTTSGPNFGTPAEHRFLRLIGSDAVD
ncbi:purine nucleoside phosphorylase-like [Ptychodera flava]|uniref:purine nucleoside phosphorylase-like n=1 Tax=Ptychodera flava TaxID=63121 RepID=UPI003969DEAB